MRVHPGAGEAGERDGNSSLEEGRKARHQRLQQQYQELVKKYRSAVESRSRSHWLGSWLLHAAREGVALLKQGRIQVANRRFYELCPPGQRWSCHTAPELGLGVRLPELIGELAERLAAGETLPPTLLWQNQAPEVRHLEMCLDSLFPGSHEVAVVLRDVTASELLRRQREEVQRRDEFLAMLAHELRNPLAPILTAAEVLRQTDDLGQVAHLAEIILRQVQHQARMVEDLLDTARVRQGKVQLRLETFDLREAVRESAAATHPQRKAQGLHFQIRFPPHPVWVKAGRTRVDQCLVNLLVNAAKFTPPGGENSICLKVRESHGWVQVADTGIGIEPAVLPRLFETFTQADQSLDRSHGGLGLGLALVHSLTELHGGGVRAHSDGLGKGAEFSMWLPLAEPPPAGPPPGVPPAAPETAGKIRSILIVDDNQAARETLEDLLAYHGFETLMAPDGPTALEVARRQRPDVVITDIGLPEMTGYELGARLRAELPNTVLIALSGYSPPPHATQDSEGPFAAYLVKPARVDTLLATLSRAMSRKT